MLSCCVGTNFHNSWRTFAITSCYGGTYTMYTGFPFILMIFLSLSQHCLVFIMCQDVVFPLHCISWFLKYDISKLECSTIAPLYLYDLSYAFITKGVWMFYRFPSDLYYICWLSLFSSATTSVGKLMKFESPNSSNNIRALLFGFTGYYMTDISQIFLFNIDSECMIHLSECSKILMATGELYAMHLLSVWNFKAFWLIYLAPVDKSTMIFKISLDEYELNLTVWMIDSIMVLFASFIALCMSCKSGRSLMLSDEPSALIIIKSLVHFHSSVFLISKLLSFCLNKNQNFFEDVSLFSRKFHLCSVPFFLVSDFIMLLQIGEFNSSSDLRLKGL